MKYVKLFSLSFVAILVCYSIMEIINARGLSAGNEDVMKKELAELMERGPLTQEDFDKLQEDADKRRNMPRDNAEILRSYKETGENIKAQARYFTWLPWLLLGILIASITPLGFVLLLSWPLILLVTDVVDPIDIVIYAFALLVGNIIRRFGFEKKIDGDGPTIPE